MLLIKEDLVDWCWHGSAGGESSVERTLTDWDNAIAAPLTVMVHLNKW